jgi:hypothetical protein
VQYGGKTHMTGSGGDQRQRKAWAAWTSLEWRQVVVCVNSKVSSPGSMHVYKSER